MDLELFISEDITIAEDIQAMKILLADVYDAIAAAEDVEGTKTTWMQGYNRRRKITITGQAGAGTNYTIRLKIGEAPNSSGYDVLLTGGGKNFPAGKGATSDLRFTTTDGISCPFWVESVSGSAILQNRLAVIYVKIPVDLGTNKDIYVYYDRDSSPDYANGAATFEFLDDFNDNFFDLSKWLKYNTGTYDEGSTLADYLTLRLAGNMWAGMHTAPQYRVIAPLASGNWEIVYKGRLPQAWVNGQEFGAGFWSSDTDWMMFTRVRVDGIERTSLTRVQADAASNQLTSYSQTDFYLRLVKNGTSYTGYTSTDGITWATWPNYTHTGITTLYVLLFGSGADDGKKGQFDFIRVKKWQATEPAYASATAEEALVQSINVNEVILGNDLTEGMAAWFKCNDNAANTIVTDATGRANGVASVNTSVLTLAGKVGNCFNFNNAYSFDIGAASYDDPMNMTDDFTFAFWYYGTDSSTFQRLFHRGTTTTPNAGGYEFAQWQGRIYCTLMHNATGGYNQFAANHTAMNAWNHIVIMKKGTVGYCYINNVEATYFSRSILNAKIQGFNQWALRVAGNGQTGGEYLKGRLDDIRIYRYAVSDAERTAIYNAGAGTETAALINVYEAEWMTGWTRRKRIRLTGQSGAGTNYQVRVKVGESSAPYVKDTDCEGHAAMFPSGQSIGGDLRFTSADGTTLLDYWVEAVTGTAPNRIATIWVEVAEDLGTDRDIYLYYGNPNAAEVVNIDNVFIHADDFNGASLNLTTKWEWVREPAAWNLGVTEAGKLAMQTYGDLYGPDNTAPVLRKKTALVSGDYEIIAKMKGTFDHSTEKIGILMWSADSNWVSSTKYFDGTHGYEHQSTIAGSTSQTLAGWGATDPMYVKIQKIGTQYKGYYSSDGITWSGGSAYTNSLANLYPALYVAATAAPYRMELFDWVIVKKVVATEPSIRLIESEQKIAYGDVVFYPGWKYRKQITISGAISAGDHYQVRLKIGESAGSASPDFHVEGHSAVFPSTKGDGGDLRFSGPDGRLDLDYWVESVSGTTPNRVAIVWVEVDEYLDNSKNIYCCYGNAGASNMANCDNTFLVADDFNDSFFDTGKWAWLHTPTVWDEGSSEVNMLSAKFEGDFVDATHTAPAFLCNSLFASGDYEITGKMKMPSTRSWDHACILFYTDDTNWVAGGRLYQGSSVALFRSTISAVSNHTYLANSLVDYYYKITKVGTLFTGYVSADGITWTQVQQIANANINTLKVGFYVGMGGGTPTLKGSIDFIWTKKCMSVEPLYSAASAEDENPTRLVSCFDTIAKEEWADGSCPSCNVYDASTVAEAILTGGIPIYFVGGFVYLGLNPVAGAKVILIREDTLAIVNTGVTDAYGYYSFSGLDVARQYHIVAEYTSGPNKYNARSLPYVNASPTLQNQSEYDTMTIAEDVNLILE